MALRLPFRILSVLALLGTLVACTLPTGSAPTTSPTTAFSEPVPTTLGACSNPWHPVIRGAQWTYSMSGISTGSFTRTITAVRTDGFTEQDVYSNGVTRTAEWKCEAGTLTALSPAEGLSAMLQTEGLAAEFRTTNTSGVTLPAVIIQGDSWAQAFTIEGTQSIAGQEAQGRGDMSYTCKAADTETVVVPAGAFDALRMGCQINGTIKVSMGGIELPTDLASVATVWHARSIGMVKTENEISGIGHSSIELMSYTVP